MTSCEECVEGLLKGLDLHVDFQRLYSATSLYDQVVNEAFMCMYILIC